MSFLWKFTIERAITFFSVVRSPSTATTVRQKLASGAVWSLFGIMIARGMGLLSSILAGRLLGVASFGELGIVRTTVLTISSLASYSLGMTSVKYIAELRFSDPEKAGRVLTLTTTLSTMITIGLATLLWTHADSLTGYLNLESGDSENMRLAGFLVIIQTFWAIQDYSLRGFQAFRLIALNSLGYGIAIVSLTTILTYLFDLRGAILALGFAALVGMLLSTYSVLRLCSKHKLAFSFRWKREDFSILYSFSLPTYISGVMVLPIIWWTYAYVSGGIDGNTEMGLFIAADQWRILILFIPQAVGAIALPMLSEAYGKRAYSEFRESLLLNITINVAISLLLCAIVIIFRRYALRAYGDDFLQQPEILILVAITAVAQSLSVVIGNVIASLGRMWWALFFNTLWAVVIVGCLRYVFSPSALGLASSFLTAYLAMTIGMSIFLTVILRDFRKSADRNHRTFAH